MIYSRLKKCKNVLKNQPSDDFHPNISAYFYYAFIFLFIIIISLFLFILFILYYLHLSTPTGLVPKI